MGGKAQLQPRGVNRAVGLERKPLSQLQPVDEELDELEQMLDNKAPVVLKTENSFGVSNFSYRSDHGDSLCCDVRLALSYSIAHYSFLLCVCVGVRACMRVHA